MSRAQAAEQKKPVVGVLYGFRALMVLFVCNYHIWQQGWLGQYLRIGNATLDFDFFTRTSYFFVDGMLLLSGFLLFLPYARQKLIGAPVPGVRRFYFNRLVRIVPSYLFSVLTVLLLIALPGGAYVSDAARNLDILSHLTFTFTFWPQTYLQTPLNGALWTVAVEMQFYLLFPWLAKAAQRKPALTLGAMMLAGWLYRLFVLLRVGELSFALNQMPSFLDVYALGMLGALGYVALEKHRAEAPPLRRALPWVAAVAFVVACWGITALLRVQCAASLTGHTQLLRSQLQLRLPFALVMLTAMLAATQMLRLMQRLLDNRLMRFLSVISFNLYIWHQVLAVRFTKLFPNTLHSEQPLQIAFTLLSFSASILVAMLTTYGLEQPVARLANSLRLRRERKVTP